MANNATIGISKKSLRWWKTQSGPSIEKNFKTLNNKKYKYRKKYVKMY